MNKTMVAVLVASLWYVAMTDAQEPPPIGTPSPGWLTWSMNYDGSPPARSGLDQAEYDELIGTLLRIGALFRQTPYLSRPPNAEISPSREALRRVGAEGIHRTGLRTTDGGLPARHPLREWPGPGLSATPGKGPVRGELRLWVFRPVYEHRNPSSRVSIQINDPWLEGRLLMEDDEGGMYLPWPLMDERAGQRRYRTDRNTVVIKILPEGRDPWVPVSQERWIRALISRTEQLLEDRRERITAEGAQRRQRLMQGYNVMKALNAEEAEKMLATFEEQERIYVLQAEAIAVGDYDGLEAAGERGLATVGRTKLALEGELAGLSAAERAAPAMGFEADPSAFIIPRRNQKRPSLLVSPDDSNALPVLAPDPAFFRHDIPTGEIQSITIINRLWAEFSDRLDEELDWTALRRMVK